MPRRCRPPKRKLSKTQWRRKLKRDDEKRERWAEAKACRRPTGAR